MTKNNEEIQPVETNYSEDEQQKQKGILVIFRFVLVPLVVVGIVIFIIILFGNIALKEKSVSDYLYDIRTGSQSERWQAAYQLSTMLSNPNKDYEAQARQHLPEILTIYEKTKGNDPKIRQYLALTMGRLHDPRAVPALQESLKDDDSQTVIWSIWALGAIGDKGSTPLIVEKLESNDAGIRTMSAYVLGALADPRAIPPLQGHLDDNTAEVSWNAAIALARMNDSSGSDLLKKMLRRDYLASFPNMTEEKKEELMINTILASAKIQNPEIQDQIKTLSTSDPSPKVRDAALKEIHH